VYGIAVVCLYVILKFNGEVIWREFYLCVHTVSYILEISSNRYVLPVIMHFCYQTATDF